MYPLHPGLDAGHPRTKLRQAFLLSWEWCLVGAWVVFSGRVIVSILVRPSQCYLLTIEDHPSSASTRLPPPAGTEDVPVSTRGSFSVL